MPTPRFIMAAIGTVILLLVTFGPFLRDAWRNSKR